MKKFLEEMSLRYLEAEQRIANRCVAFASHLLSCDELLALQTISHTHYEKDKAFMKSCFRNKKRNLRRAK